MKKNILLGTLVFTLICSYSFANDKDKGIIERAKASFRNEFVNAEAVQWEDLGLFVKASFRMNDQVLYAFFDPDGDLLAVTRNILSDQLPIPLLTLLEKKYPGYWITDLFELYTGGETSYYITLKNGDREKVLKSVAGGGWEVYRTKKVLL
ncbi:MAG TPA: hypothetical protein VF939_22030 [Puia sp.]